MMTALSVLGAVPRCLMLMGCLMLACGGISLTYYILDRYLRRSYLAIVAFSVALGLLAQAMLMLSSPAVSFGEGTRAAAFASGLPAAVPLALLGVGGVLYLPLTLQLSHYLRHHILPLSVRESFDRIGDGVCFYTEDGGCRLVNPAMDELCLEITGDRLNNGAAFWKLLREGAARTGAKCLSPGEQPVWRLGDGRIIQFQESLKELPDGPMRELTGSDVTEEMRQSEMLAEENDRLQRLNDRLYDYGTMLTELTVEKETLDFKIRIHDGFGRTIQQTRRYLGSGGAEGDQEAILMGWLEIRSLLHGLPAEQEPEHDESLRGLEEAAASVGLTIEVNGTLPPELTHRKVFVIGATECLLNAARAGAKKLTADITREGGWAVFRYTNDGAAPDGPVREGGGLSFVREKTEYEGGTMEVLHDPAFALILRLPVL